MTCNHCGKRIPPLSRYCPDCGNRNTKLPRPVFPKAGQRRRDPVPDAASQPYNAPDGGAIPSWFAQREKTWNTRLIQALLWAALAVVIWLLLFR